MARSNLIDGPVARKLWNFDEDATKIERDVTSGLLWGPNFCMDYVWEWDFVSPPAP